MRRWTRTENEHAPNDEESACRNVIAWVWGRTNNDPERQAAVVGRLEEELRQLRQARAGGAL